METPGRMTTVISFTCTLALAQLIDKMVELKQREDQMRRVKRSEVIRQALITEMHACGILSDNAK